MQANSSEMTRILNIANNSLKEQNYQAAIDHIDSNWDLYNVKEAKVIRIRALIGLDRFVEVRRAILFCDIISKDVQLRKQLVKEYKDAIEQHGITDNFVWNVDKFGGADGIDNDPIALDAVKKADALFNDKKFHDACSQYSVALERNLRTSEIYFKRGTCFYELKQYAKAMEDARAMDNADNGIWDNWDDTTYDIHCKVLEIRSAIEMGNFDVARFAILYNNLILSDQTVREQLIQEYKTKLVELNIDDETDWDQTENNSIGNLYIEDPVTQNYIKQADVQFQQQNWSDAIVLYNQAVDKTKYPNDLHLKRGQCYFALGDFQNAYDDFIWCNAGGRKILTMIALKRYEEAYAEIIDFSYNAEETISRNELVEEWENALANDGMAFLIGIIKSTARSDQPNQNDNQSMNLEPAASCSGYNVMLRETSDSKAQKEDEEKARISFANKQYHTAKREFSLLISKQPKAEHFLGRAECCLQLKEFVMAYEDVRMAMNLKTPSLDAHILEGRVLSGLCRYEEAEHMFVVVREQLSSEQHKEELMKQVVSYEIENRNLALLSMGVDKERLSEYDSKVSIREALDL